MPSLIATLAPLDRLLAPVGIGAPELRLVVSLLLLVTFLLVHRVFGRSVRKFVSAGHLTEMMGRRLRETGRLVTLGMALLVAMHAVGAFDNAWAVFTAVLTTVAIGFFAVWSVLSNTICAVLILIYRPFQIGDEIELIDGSSNPFPRGKVSDLNLLFVTLEEIASDGAVLQLRIPNVLIFQKVVRRRRAPGEQRNRFF